MASSPAPPPKRRKRPLACDQCRNRKVGCDGVRPACGMCVIRGWEDRCAYQERDGEVRTQRMPTNSQRATPRPQPRESQPGLLQWRPSPPSRAQPRPEVSHEEDSDRAVYGPSSNVSFARQVVIAAEMDSPDTASGSGGGDGGGTASLIGFSTPGPSAVTPDDRAHQAALEDIVLPTRQLADRLLQCYWDFLHTVLPLLHRPSFEAEYATIWQPRGAAMPGPGRCNHDLLVFHAILNMVLALGCRRDESLQPARREPLAKEFYQRSCSLVSIDFLDHASLAVVQLLLLRGNYLLHTPHADRCWNVMGVTLRVAQGLGLDCHRAGASRLSQVKREMRRRVWWSVAYMDW